MTTRSLVLALALLLAPIAALAQEPTPPAPDTAYTPGAYRVFTGAGAPATLDDVVRAMAPNQVVFIGETHDDPTAHLLELELLQRARDAYGTGANARPVALSLEFFDRDAQLPLDEYLAGFISESAFRSAARPWPRYQSDYRPLVEFAKANALPVIAANAPRRYVTMVTREGRASLDRLGEQARTLLPPLPYGKASPAYRDQWIAVMSNVLQQEGMKCGVPTEKAAAPPGSHGNMTNQLDSQVLWDATMAHAIARHLQAQPRALVLHMVGGFHVERGTGTPEQLQAYLPGARALIISLRPVADIATFQPAPAGTWGDFVIQTDRSRTLEEIECRQFRSKQAK